MFDDRTLRCLLCKKFGKVILFWCHEIAKRRVANGTKSSGLNLRIFAVKGNSGAWLRKPLC